MISNKFEGRKIASRNPLQEPVQIVELGNIVSPNCLPENLSVASADNNRVVTCVLVCVGHKYCSSCPSDTGGDTHIWGILVFHSESVSEMYHCTLCVNAWVPVCVSWRWSTLRSQMGDFIWPMPVGA